MNRMTEEMALIRYERRHRHYGKIYEKIAKKSNRMSNLRLIVFIVGLAVTIALYKTPYVSAGAFFFFFGVFIYLLVRHNKLKSTREYVYALKTINEKSIKRLNGEWNTFPDFGQEFIDDKHPYAKDLDLFGQGSLFQAINITHTYLGRKALASLLTKTPENKEKIKERQESILELGNDLKWCQHFAADGMVNSKKMADPEDLFRWINKENGFIQKKPVQALIRFFPLLTILLFVLSLTASAVPMRIPVIMLTGQALALFAFSGQTALIVSGLAYFEESIRAYYKLLKRIDEKQFKSQLLRHYQSQLRNKDNIPAYEEVKKLSKLTDSISNRNNAYFLIMNILLLWDYQCLIALEQWKKKTGSQLAKWFETVGQIEALVSLATIVQDHPEWAMPMVTEGEPYFSAKHMGHPLLGKERVCNNLTIAKPSGILLITGSNMSGKSTLLRTVGLNLVLAYAGAPVCAQTLTCSIMRIYTCMRVNDNLQKSISSFYAEILRIKLLVEALKIKEPPILFLLDEIFKGTNSEDRHLGAKYLIHQLHLNGAIGLVSTHDLELGDLEELSHGKIKNYHFREYYENGEIKFDYKLRRGISTTRNAIYLINMAGIEIDEENMTW